MRGKGLIVFVHGFGSSPATWDSLLALFRSDPNFAGFDFDCFGYPSPWFNFNPLGRIPRLRELGQALEAHMQAARLQLYENVTLVGHSQGGLVIQSYLAGKLIAGQGESLKRIRQAILIATPNLGSAALSRTRELISHVLPNPQERTLRMLNDEIADLRREVEARIGEAKTRADTQHAIPVRCFWGLNDGVVPEASAKGSFHVLTPLRGDHFSVLQPSGPEDENYRLLAEAILDPIGHENVFEIDWFEQRLAVEPLSPPQEVICKHGTHERKVCTDNVAHLVRMARFSRGNRCTGLFAMGYGTRNNGFLSWAGSVENQAPSDEKRLWDDYGTQANFKFTPKAGETYTMRADIYKGFDAGQRDAHFHLRRDRNYKKVRFSLDLSAYLKSGWRVTREPALYLHHTDPEDHDMCKLRPLENPVEAIVRNQSGLWVWELERVREGVADLVWDVAEGAVMGAGS
jgi:pimeloyl-ACP methyl ester carboxylesterase